MSDVGKTGAEASVVETVAETPPAVVETTVEKTEEAETETTTEEVTETPVEGAEVVETEEQKKTKSALRREKQKAREAAQDARIVELQEKLAAAERNKPTLDGIGPKPEREKYEDESEYQADLNAWKVEERITLRQQKAHETTVSELRGETTAKQMEQFKERVMALKPTNPDIEIVFNDKTFPMSAAMAETLMTSKRGAEVAAYLVANREEAQSIKEMSPLAAASELGRISATLGLPKSRTETKAPPPPSTVSGTVRGPNKSPENMSQAEYVAWRSKGGGETRTG